MSKPNPDGERQFAVHSAIADLAHAFDVYLQWVAVKEAMTICRHQNLPHQIVPKDDLLALLSQAKDNVRQYRQDLLVPTDQVTFIMTCVMWNAKSRTLSLM